MRREVTAAILCMAMLGCGSTVATATGGSGSTTTSAAMPPATTVSGTGPGCPDQAPGSYAPCMTEGLGCTYTTGPCVLSYSCHSITYDPETDPFACGPSMAWIRNQQTQCDGCAGGSDCVPCSMAQEGQPCDAVDYFCAGNGGGNCGVERTCLSNHTWSEIDEPGCCI